MGKAAVDLPDPLGPSDLPTNADADDLLSQLAGEQIDQLLHEAPPKFEGPRVAVRDVAEDVSVEVPPRETPPPVVDDVVERHALVDVLTRAAETDELPAALRPLEWINAPFGNNARQTLGRLGLLLLMNAIAVILYVLIFGRL